MFPNLPKTTSKSPALSAEEEAAQGCALVKEATEMLLEQGHPFLVMEVGAGLGERGHAVLASVFSLQLLNLGVRRGM